MLPSWRHHKHVCLFGRQGHGETTRGEEAQPGDVEWLAVVAHEIVTRKAGVHREVAQRRKRWPSLGGHIQPIRVVLVLVVSRSLESSEPAALDVDCDEDGRDLVGRVAVVSIWRGRDENAVRHVDPHERAVRGATDELGAGGDELTDGGTRVDPSLLDHARLDERDAVPARKREMPSIFCPCGRENTALRHRHHLTRSFEDVHAVDREDGECFPTRREAPRELNEPRWCAAEPLRVGEHVKARA